MTRRQRHSAPSPRGITTTIRLTALALAAFGLLGCEGRGCVVDGKTYRDGMRWTCADGCNFCSCDDGVYGHTQMACGPLFTDTGDAATPVDSGADAGNDAGNAGDAGDASEAGTARDASMLPGN